LVVVETAGHQAVDDSLARMAERRVVEIVSQRDGFSQLFVKPQHLRERCGDLRDLEGVGEPGAVVISGGGEKHLRLVFQTTKRLRVDDALPIALKRRPEVIFALGAQPSARGGTLCRLRRERFVLAGLELLSERSAHEANSR